MGLALYIVIAGILCGIAWVPLIAWHNQEVDHVMGAHNPNHLRSRLLVHGQRLRTTARTIRAYGVRILSSTIYPCVATAWRQLMKVIKGTTKDIAVAHRPYPIRSAGPRRQNVVTIPKLYLELLDQDPEAPDVSVRMYYRASDRALVLVPEVDTEDNSG